MLFSIPTLSATVEDRIKTAPVIYSTDACLAFLPQLMDRVSSISLPYEAHEIRALFIQQCRDKIAALQPMAAAAPA